MKQSNLSPKCGIYLEGKLAPLNIDKRRMVKRSIHNCFMRPSSTIFSKMEGEQKLNRDCMHGMQVAILILGLSKANRIIWSHWGMCFCTSSEEVFIGLSTYP